MCNSNIIVFTYFFPIFLSKYVQTADLLRNPLSLIKLTKPFEDIVNYSLISDAQCRLDTRFWLRSVDEFSYAFSINCTQGDKDCLFFKQHLVDKYLFAAKQLDSYGRVPADVFSLISIWMGSWKECINVYSSQRSDYKTQFCYVYVGLSIPIKSDYLAGVKKTNDICDSPILPKWSVCVPRKCPEKDITAVFRGFNDENNSLIKFCRAECRPATLPEPTLGFWIIISIFIVTFLLVATSSVFDYCTETEKLKCYRDPFAIQCFLKFSMYTNGAEILSVKKVPNRINCLESIRAVTITWVMIGHVLAIYLEGDNTLQTLENTVYILNDVFTTAYVAVDTFFFISGLLVGYIFFKALSKNPDNIKSPLFWLLYYVHRYLRLSPPYFIFIAAAAVFSDYVTFGPVIFFEMISGVPCQTEWWRNVLYINKMYDNGGDCLPHTWYLAADMQMFIFAPLILIPLFLSPRTGFSIGFILVIVSMIINYGIFFKYDFPANYIGYFSEIYKNNNRANYDQMVYYAVWLRFTPYLVGIFTGYFLFKTQRRKLHLHWIFAVLLWIASFLTGIACVYSLYDYFQGPSHRISTLASASYNFWTRIGWAMAMAWVVIACEKNWAGPIKDFLEQGFWYPFGRLTYCAYLVHALAIPLIYSMGNRPIHYVSTHHAYVREALPLFVVTFTIAFIWCVSFEIPFAKLEALIVGRFVGNRLRLKPSTEAKKSAVKPIIIKPKTFVDNDAEKKTKNFNDCNEENSVCKL